MPEILANSVGPTGQLLLHNFSEDPPSLYLNTGEKTNLALFPSLCEYGILQFWEGKGDNDQSTR